MLSPFSILLVGDVGSLRSIFRWSAVVNLIVHLFHLSLSGPFLKRTVSCSRLSVGLERLSRHNSRSGQCKTSQTWRIVTGECCKVSGRQADDDSLKSAAVGLNRRQQSRQTAGESFCKLAEVQPEERPTIFLLAPISLPALDAAPLVAAE